VVGRELGGLSPDVVLFLLATIVTALVGGLGPELVAAAVGGLLLTSLSGGWPVNAFSLRDGEASELFFVVAYSGGDGLDASTAVRRVAISSVSPVSVPPALVVHGVRR
jgi:hypothetical protein